MSKVTVAEKLSAIGNNMARVYDTGFEKGYDQGFEEGKQFGDYGQGFEEGQKSMVDESKLLPTTTTGDGFVHLSDLSEIPHEVTIQAAEGTKVTVVRNNLFDIDNFRADKVSYAPDPYWWERLDDGIMVCDTLGGWIYRKTTLLEDIEEYKGADIVISATISSKQPDHIGIIKPNLKNANGEEIKLPELAGEGDVSGEFVIPSDATGYKLMVLLYSSCGGALSASGENKIAYSNVYVARREDVFQYTVDASGVIDGIKSADNITVIADGTVSVTYNKSYGRYKALSDFWKRYTAKPNGEPKAEWSYAFYGGGWDSRTFRPTVDIVMTGTASRAFNAWSHNDLELIDLGAHLRRLGVSLDTSQCTKIDYMFFYSMLIGAIPTIDATGCTTEASSKCLFSRAEFLRRIEKIKVNENTYYTLWFEECKRLEEVRFEGIIAQNMDLHWSIKLSRESIESIITHLSDTASGKTLTLSKVAVDDAYGWYIGDSLAPGSSSGTWDELVVSKPNWTITLV